MIKKSNKLMNVLVICLCVCSLVFVSFEVKANEETAAVRGPAQSISKYNVLEMWGYETPVSQTTKTTFSQSSQNYMDKCTFAFEEAYYSGKTITIKIRQRGTNGYTSVTAPGSFVLKESPTDLEFGSDGGVIEFTDIYELMNINTSLNELKVECVAVGVPI